MPVTLISLQAKSLYFEFFSGGNMPRRREAMMIMIPWQWIRREGWLGTRPALWSPPGRPSQGFPTPWSSMMLTTMWYDNDNWRWRWNLIWSKVQLHLHRPLTSTRHFPSKYDTLLELTHSHDKLIITMLMNVGSKIVFWLWLDGHIGTRRSSTSQTAECPVTTVKIVIVHPHHHDHHHHHLQHYQ